MTTADERPDEQTPGQWAVRWFVVLSVALLCVSVPLLHLYWHVLLANDEPMIRTRAQRAAPEATADAILDGQWMLDKQRQLQEDSPVTWSLRGNWNELRYLAGVPQSRVVHFGRDEWFFIRTSIRPNNAGFARATAARRRFLAGVRDVVEAAGAELMVVVIPDKARVYPDKAFADGELPPNKRDNYTRILAELGELGIATVDLATPLVAARRALTSDEPVDQLFYARDTHWRPPGALVGGQVVAAAIEARYLPLIGERLATRLSGPTMVRAVGDLTAQLGILSIVQSDEHTGQRTVAMSLLSDRLAEQRQYYGVELVRDGRAVAMFGDDPDAAILLIGTSFSEENGMNALSLALGRPVRGQIIRGAQGMKPLEAALAELRGGTRAKVVVWEMVERGWFEGAWLDPKLPD